MNCARVVCYENPKVYFVADPTTDAALMRSRAIRQLTWHPREREICAAVEAQLERDRRRKQFQQMLYGNQSIEKDLSL